MAKQLHILNGFSTHHLFVKSGLTGDVCVWDEILSEGPGTYAIASEQFWAMRRSFVAAAFGAADEQYDVLIQHFAKIQSYESYDELVLWYEYDLFCQVNLMALLSWLYVAGAHRKTTIQLICVGEEPGFPGLVGLGQLPASKYPALYARRAALSDSDMSYADSVWRAYSGDDPRALAFATSYHTTFTYLSDAIKAHYRRFPDDSGLNEIEHEILKFVSVEKPGDVRRLVRHLLLWQRYYGFGDLQYFYYIKALRAFINFDEPLALTEVGKQALNTGINRGDYPEMELTLGGSNANDYYRKGDQLYPQIS